MDFRRPQTWAFVTAGFFFVACLVYGASLGNDFVRWDDGLLIFENPAIRGFSLENLKTIFTTYDPELYIPLTLLSYQFDYLIAGNNAAIYHLHNLILHVLNAALVVGVIRLFSKTQWVAIACGALFLLHPLHTEAVAWSSARKDLLSSMFMLVSLLSYFTYVSSDSKKYYVASLCAFTLGLLAKVTILGLPMLLLLGLWYQGAKWTKVRLLEIAPYFGLSAIFAVIAAFGKTSILSAVTPVETFAMAGKSTVFYLSKLLVPMRLSVLYPYNEQIALTSPDFLVPLGIVFALAAAVLFSLKYNKYMAFGAAFFAITLVPSLLNFAKAGTYYIASDRYAYLPSIGVLLILAMLLKKVEPKKLVFGGLAAVLLVFAYATHAQSMVWNNSEALFAHTLKHYPESHAARNNMGNVYRRRGQLAEATAEYEAALAIETYAGKTITEFGLPSVADKNRAQILSNLGSTQRASGLLAQSHDTFTQALNLDATSPQVHLGMAITKQQMGQSTEAEAAFKKAIELQPNLAVAYLNLGALYINTGNIEDGIAQYQLAIKQNPFFPQAFYNLGIALRKLSRNREAKDAFMQAVELQPNYVAARINLGILLAERQDRAGAIEQFEAVLKYDPSNANALSALQQLR